MRPAAALFEVGGPSSRNPFGTNTGSLDSGDTGLKTTERRPVLKVKAPCPLPTCSTRGLEQKELVAPVSRCAGRGCHFCPLCLELSNRVLWEGLI